ncbi:MAG: GDP-mannose 4,6-dehydratase [Planctomycetota bacterium]|nr:GDP-mannose 4,6-dehydratase [Planctomycetota bacterium]
MADPTILITGAAGFIGSNLADALLARGLNVAGLDNFCDFYPEARKRANLQSAMANPRFDLVEADLRDRPAVLEAFSRHKPAVVVHLAAMAGVRPSIENPSYYAAVNVSGTVNVLDAAVAHGTTKFLFASSSSVYGNNPKTPFAEEDNVDHPISPYAATKKAGELICHTYWHIHRLPVVCLRFFTVFGPRQRPDLAINKFLRLIGSGQTVPMFGDGSTSRDYTFVGDIVAGISAAIEGCTPERGHRVYNLGGNHPVSLRELIETVERVVGKPAKIERLPMQPGDVERTWADLSRSGAELGYRPVTTLEEGISRQWEWMRKSGL